MVKLVIAGINRPLYSGVLTCHKLIHPTYISGEDGEVMEIGAAGEMLNLKGFRSGPCDNPMMDLQVFQFRQRRLMRCAEVHTLAITGIVNVEITELN